MAVLERRRPQYWEVPQHQQPLRVNARPRRPAVRLEFYSNPLEQLVVAPHAYGVPRGLADQDRLEILDAAWEDSNGRLPHEPGYIEPIRKDASMSYIEPIRKDEPTATGYTSTILAALETRPCNARELEDACGVGRSALAHLLRALEHGDELHVSIPGRPRYPTVYKLGPKPETNETEPAMPDPTELDALRDRYVRMLAAQHPERLLKLIDGGKLEPTVEHLDAIERYLFAA